MKKCIHNQYILFPFFAFFLLVIILFYYLNIFIDLNPLKNYLVVVYISYLVIAILKNGLLDLYSMFLITSGIFIYSRVFFDIFAKIPFLQLTFLSVEMLDEKIGFLFCIVAILFLVFTDLGFNWPNRRKKIFLNTNKLDYRILGKLAAIIMLITFPFSLYKLYIQFKYINENGYLALYFTDFDKLDYPIWTKGATLVFGSFYFIFMLSRPKKSLAIIFTILFVLLSITSALKGQRGPLIVTLLSLAVLFNKIFNIKINLIKIIAGLLVIIIFSQYIYYSRSNTKITENNMSASLLSTFFYDQGTTIMVPLVVMNNQIVERKYPFIFSPIGDLVTKKIRNNQYLEPTSDRLYALNNISDSITFSLNQNAYLDGSGTGSCVLAEFYDFFGIYGIPFISFLFGFFISYIKESIRIDYRNSIFLFPIIKSIIYSPRNRFFSFINDYTIIVIVILIIIIFNGLTLGIGRRNEK